MSDAESPRRAAVVYNPVKVDRDDLEALVAQAEKAHGWQDTTWIETSVDDPGHDAAAEVIEGGATLVVAVGGDGTVRAVAEAVTSSGASLALVPRGTGNLLARNLDLTIDDLDRAIDVAFGGEDRQIDTARIEIRREDDAVEEHTFIVMAGIGLDAKMLAETDDDLKAKVGWLAYVKAILEVLRSDNRLRFGYRLDDEKRRTVSAHTIIVGNCGSLPANILLLPDAAVDDGLVDIVIMKPTNVVGWIELVWKIFWENGVLRRTKWGRRLPARDVDAVAYARGRKLTVRLNHPEEIQLDGDSFGMATGFRVTVQPSSLTVRVPAGEAPEETAKQASGEESGSPEPAA